MKRPQSVLVAGCGYLGRQIASLLVAREASVTGWVRSRDSARELEALSIHPHVGDIANANHWQQLGHPFDAVIHCASSGRGGPEVYNRVYLEGIRLACAAQPDAKIIFVSSTSVYGHADGSVVTEESPAEPLSPTSQILRQAEDCALARGGIVARSSGIYGPGRCVLVNKWLRGDAVEGDGSRWINQIHRDDLAQAILFLLEHGQPGQIYNCTDSEPVTQRDFYQWIAARLNKPEPPYGAPVSARKRGQTNKRVSNQKLLALGWKPLYPGFQQGLPAALGI